MKFTFGNLPSIGWVDPVGKLVELAQLCEREGMDRFGVSDWRFYHDCFVVMTACLQATERLEVESLVTDPYVRHPSLTALAHATMDDLSRGRVILGIGAGVEQPTFWDYERRLPMTAVREGVEICRRMFAGEKVTYQGKVIGVEGAKLDFTPYRRDLPIMIAARGGNMLELAGELADIVHLASFFVSVGHQRENLERVRRGADRAGRRMGTFEIDISMPCSVSEDREAARRAAKRPAAQGILWTAAAERYSRERKDWVRPKQFNVPEHVVEALASWDFWTEARFPDRLADLISDEVLDQFALAGTPEECAARLLALQRELPEVTGVRIYAVPPAGKPLFEGYVDMVRGFGRVARLVNAGARLSGPEGVRGAVA
ncbi:MAG TPA: LLM class flavin-dependent oxidoreductase [Candidatus Limnocylindria bacterium]|nr:LLM class flavin-dependent oxidoreductase [Candidatus Limnocylindria bacterium]